MSNKYSKNGSETAMTAPGSMELDSPIATAMPQPRPANVAALRDRIESGEWECAPQIVKIEEGMELEGILEGHGPVAELVDRVTGEVREIATWIVANATRTARVSFLSSAQLERKLPPFVGGLVVITRGKNRDIQGGHRIAEYLVSGPRLPNGKLRDFGVKDEEVPLLTEHAEA